MEGNIDAIAQLTVILSHTNELEIPELADDKTNPPENHKDNGATTPVNTQPPPSHLPLEDTLVDSAEPPIRPCIEAVNTALQLQEGYLPDVRLFGASYMLYGVYQDWVHKNTGYHLDGGIAKDSKWKERWKISFLCRPNATTQLTGKLGRDLWESCL